MQQKKQVNVGYLRCAYPDQNSIEAQKQAIIEQASQHNITIQRWYEDNGISAHSFNRPGLDRLRVDIHKDIDSVYITEMSRLARSLSQVIDHLDEFKKAGVKVYTLPLSQTTVPMNMDMLGSDFFSEELEKMLSSKIKKTLEHLKKR